MPEITGHVLVLTDGSLAGLTCAALAARRAEEGQRPAVLVPASLETRAAEDARAAAEHLGLGTVELNAGRATGGPGETRLLLVAAQTAAQNGCSTLIWGAQLGGTNPTEHVSEIALAADRALLVSRLVSLDLPEDEPLEIETPVLDLADDQLAELAMDLGAPFESCRWWGGAGAEAERWTEAFRAAGWRPDTALV